MGGWVFWDFPEYGSRSISYLRAFGARFPKSGKRFPFTFSAFRSAVSYSAQGKCFPVWMYQLKITLKLYRDQNDQQKTPPESYGKPTTAKLKSSSLQNVDFLFLFLFLKE